MRRMLALVFVSLVVLPSQAFAQQGSGPAVALNNVPVAIAVSADAGSARRSSDVAVRPGSLRDAITRESARPSQSSAPAASSQPGTSRSWTARHPVRAGFLIGAAAGAVVGVASCANAPEFAGLCAAAGLGAGGGAGALVGLAF